MKTNLLLWLSLTLVGCRSADHHAVVVPIVPPPPLPAEQQGSVWTGDEIAAYAVGRYVDPRNANVVHEAHTLYRREQSGRPNLTPPTGLVFPAPDTGASSITNATGFLRDALTAELNQQRAVSRQLIEQSQSLQQQATKFSGQAQAIRDSLTDSLRLRSEVDRLTNRVEQLEQRARSDQAGPTSKGQRQ